MKIQLGKMLSGFGVFAAVIIFNGCGSYTQMKSPVENNTPALLYSLPPGEFGHLWIQRTVRLTMQSPSGLSNPLLGGSGEERKGSRSIPMDINVTFLDSALVNAGLEQFEQLAGMTSQEKTDYENRYKNQFLSGDSYLFWMELNSPYSEDALGTDKWTFYLEDEKGNTFEPAKITELPSQSMPSHLREQNNPKGNFFRLNNKVYLLSFAKKGFNNYDMVNNTAKLKMVYFEWSSRDFKREGTLDLSSIKSNKIELKD